MTQKKTHTFIVANDDESQLYLHASIVAKDNHKIVAFAKDGAELISLATIHKPEYILSDLVMPHKNGIDACLHIKLSDPSIKCIITSSFRDIGALYQSAFYKLNGFLFNDITSHKLQKCLSEIASNKFYLDLTYRKDFLLRILELKPQLNQLAKWGELAGISELSDLTQLPDLSDISELSDVNKTTPVFDEVEYLGKHIKINDRHILLVSAVYHCMQRQQIADLLHISESSVDTSVKRLKRSLSIEDRVSLIKLFKDWGYIKENLDD